MLDLTEATARRVGFLHEVCTEVLSALHRVSLQGGNERDGDESIQDGLVSLAQPAVATAAGAATGASAALACSTLLDVLHSSLRRVAPLGGPEGRSRHQVWGVWGRP